MAQICRICQLDNRLEVDKALLAGKSLASICRQFGGFSADSLARHRDKHLTKRLVTITKQREEIANLDIRREIENLIVRVKEILNYAELHKQHNVFLKASAELRNNLDLLLKIAIALNDARTQEKEADDVYKLYKEEQVLTANLLVLTDSELIMLNRLRNKLDSQDPKDVILPDTTPFITNTTPKKYNNEEIPENTNELNVQANDTVKPKIRLRPIEPEQIPGTSSLRRRLSNQ